MLRSNSKSLGNHVVCPEEEKEGYGGKNFQKKIKPGMKECSDEYAIHDAETAGTVSNV